MERDLTIGIAAIFDTVDGAGVVVGIELRVHLGRTDGNILALSDCELPAR
jgi:hypothetical protein